MNFLLFPSTNLWFQDGSEDFSPSAVTDYRNQVRFVNLVVMSHNDRGTITPVLDSDKGSFSNAAGSSSCACSIKEYCEKLNNELIKSGEGKINDAYFCRQRRGQFDEGNAIDMNLAFARGSTGMADDNVTEFSRCKYASNDDYRLQVEISDAYGDLLKCLHEICACDVAVKLEFEVMERQVRSPRPYGLMALLNEYGYNNDEQDQQRGRARQEDRGRDRSRSRSGSPHRRGNADEHGEAEANEEQNGQDIIRAKFETREMRIKASTSNGIKAGSYFCEDVNVSILKRLFEKWDTSCKLRCKIIVTVADATNSLAKDRFEDASGMNRILLDKEINTDMTIVANNGVAIKCHQLFLKIHSPVLQAMLEVDMTESQTKRVEMEDMSENVVRALLAYLYTFDVKPAQENDQIALELLQAGHKYDIRELERSMTNLLLEQPIYKFGIAVAIRLFCFARGLPNGEKLKQKAVRILKANPDKLEQCSVYQELFVKNIPAVKDLYQCTLATWNSSN